MRKYIILFFLGLPFLFACDNSGVPDGIMPPDQMTSLLTEVHLTDGSLSIFQQLPDTLYKYGAARYLAIFKKYNTDTAQFRKSYLYYCSRPQQLIDMNVKILAELQIKTDSLKKLLTKRQSEHPQKRVVNPVSTFHPGGGGRYGVGVVPQSAVPNRIISGHAAKVPMVPQRFRSKQDSLLKAKIKNKHAVQ